MRRASHIINILIGFLLLLMTFANGCKEDSNPEVPVKLKAAFSAVPFEGHSPLEVQFNDKSTGATLSWKWDFKDDGTFDAFLSDPSFTYDEPGYYSVKLVVSDGEASDSVTMIDYVYLNRDDVQLNYDGTLSPKVGGLVEIPLKVGLDAEIGAMTIKLFYDNRLMEVDSIAGDMGGFLSSIVHENGSIIIAWSSVTPLNINQGEDLFRIKATILTGVEVTSHYMRVGAGTEFADPSANILTDVELIIPSLDTPE